MNTPTPLELDSLSLTTASCGSKETPAHSRPVGKLGTGRSSCPSSAAHGHVSVTFVRAGSRHRTLLVSLVGCTRHASVTFVRARTNAVWDSHM